MIAQQALRIFAVGHKTVVVSDGNDVIILLVHYSDVQNLPRFLSEATKKSKAGLQVFCIRHIMESIGQLIVKSILYLQARSGCDTTSATFGHGKGALLKRYTRKRQSDQ